MWKKLEKKFLSVGSRIGLPIDKGIFETVVALNALGINTTQSCEGHVDHGAGGPEVDIEARNIKKLGKEITLAYEKALENSKSGVNLDEDKKLWDKYYEKSMELRKKHIKAANKLLLFLEEFYKNRQVSFQNRLILLIDGSSRARLQNHGAEYQDAFPIKVRQENLLEYQKEMKDFTTFLKEKYFAAGGK